MVTTWFLLFFNVSFPSFLMLLHFCYLDSSWLHGDICGVYIYYWISSTINLLNMEAGKEREHVISSKGKKTHHHQQNHYHSYFKMMRMKMRKKMWMIILLEDTISSSFFIFPSSCYSFTPWEHNSVSNLSCILIIILIFYHNLKLSFARCNFKHRNQL